MVYIVKSNEWCDSMKKIIDSIKRIHALNIICNLLCIYSTFNRTSESNVMYQH